MSPQRWVLITFKQIFISIHIFLYISVFFFTISHVKLQCVHVYLYKHTKFVFPFGMFHIPLKSYGGYSSVKTSASLLLVVMGVKRHASMVWIRIVCLRGRGWTKVDTIKQYNNYIKKIIGVIGQSHCYRTKYYRCCKLLFLKI